MNGIADGENLVFYRNVRAANLLPHETGTLEAGKSADFAIWDIESPAELVCRIGFTPLHARVFKGQRIVR